MPRQCLTSVGHLPIPWLALGLRPASGWLGTAFRILDSALCLRFAWLWVASSRSAFSNPASSRPQCLTAPLDHRKAPLGSRSPPPRSQPPLSLLPIRHRPAQQCVERRAVVPGHQVTKLVRCPGSACVEGLLELPGTHVHGEPPTGQFVCPPLRLKTKAAVANFIGSLAVPANLRWKRLKCVRDTLRVPY